MRDLGTFRGTNHPLSSVPTDIRDVTYAFIALVVAVVAVFAISSHTLPRAERAYQMENV